MLLLNFNYVRPLKNKLKMAVLIRLVLQADCYLFEEQLKKINTKN